MSVAREMMSEKKIKQLKSPQSKKTCGTNEEGSNDVGLGKERPIRSEETLKGTRIGKAREATRTTTLYLHTTYVCG
jgi:hypothetical protein